MALSADGTGIAAIGGLVANQIFISPDFATNWAAANAPAGAKSILISADGSKFAALIGGNIYISEPNPPPVLSVAISGGDVLLSWMQPVSNFVLQQSADLTSWSAVTNAPQLNITNLQNQVQLPLSPTQAFFRLREP